MEYQTFQTRVLEELKGYFPDTCSIEPIRVLKNNGVYWDAVTIRESGSAVSPTIYLSAFWERLQEGDLANIKEAASAIFESYLGQEPKDDINIDFYRAFDIAKPHIVGRLINYEKNRAFLEDVPHKRFLDLAVIYTYVFTSEEALQASIIVTNEHIASWGVGVDDLDALALRNSERLLMPQIEELNGLLSRMMGCEMPVGLAPEDGTLFVLTNNRRLFGASCILYPRLLETFSDQIDADFLIIPSSVHEVILVVPSDIASVPRLNALVREVNEAEIDETEVLSDHVYLYSRKNREVLCCA